MKRMRIGLVFFLVPLPFLFISCSSFSGLLRLPSHLDSLQAIPTADAEGLLSELRQTSSDLQSFKGIGSISLRYHGTLRMKERIAWIGAGPACFRIAVLSAGHPVMKLAGDGTWLYYHDLRDPDGSIRKVPSRDPDLKRLMPVSIKASDFLAFLSGGIPVCKHQSVDLFREPTSGHHVLVLRRWWRVVEKIYLDSGTSEPRRVETFDWSGRLRYRANLSRTKAAAGYRIPTAFRISNGEDAELVVSVDRYWPNAPVSPAMFTME